MKKTLYYRTMLRRENGVKLVFNAIFFYFASYPRLLLEVFIRKDFGERYFKFSSALTVAVLLALFPLATNFRGKEIMPDYLLWYAFLIAFVGFSFKHRRDQERNPSVYDFKKYSLDNGKINPFFYKLVEGWSKGNTRLIECYLEPAGFFVLGFCLLAIGQSLGGLLIVSSIFYGGGYAAAYTAGDHFVMDTIDDIILNEELESSFMNDKSGDETRGFRFVGRKPQDQDLRRRVYDHMTEKDEVFEAL